MSRAARLGDDDSLKVIKENYANGIVSKEDFAAALRSYQAAVEAMKSPDRDIAEREGRNTCIQWVRPETLLDQ